jgi:hypothetical protein
MYIMAGRTRVVTAVVESPENFSPCDMARIGKAARNNGKNLAGDTLTLNS